MLLELEVYEAVNSNALNSHVSSESIVQCANRPKLMNCYEREQLFILLMVSMADVNLTSLAVLTFCLFQRSPPLCE